MFVENRVTNDLPVYLDYSNAVFCPEVHSTLCVSSTLGLVSSTLVDRWSTHGPWGLMSCMIFSHYRCVLALSAICLGESDSLLHSSEEQQA